MRRLRLRAAGLGDESLSSRERDELRDELLNEVTVHTGTPFDVLWPYKVEGLEPAAMLKARAKQKMQLGRYGRQPWSQWANLPLEELEEAHEALREILDDEHAFARDMEDR